jgi:hypothetical protein
MTVTIPRNHTVQTARLLKMINDPFNRVNDTLRPRTERTWGGRQQRNEMAQLNASATDVSRGMVPKEQWSDYFHTTINNILHTILFSYLTR